MRENTLAAITAAVQAFIREEETARAWAEAANGHASPWKKAGRARELGNRGRWEEGRRHCKSWRTAVARFGVDANPPGHPPQL